MPIKSSFNMHGDYVSSPQSVYRAYWILYILLLIFIFLINCILSFYSLFEVSLAIKIYTIRVSLPSTIYLLESFITRSKYVEFLSEMKSINSIFKSSTRKQVMQLSKKNNLKIIFVLLLFIVQLVVISVKCFVYETFDLNV